MTENNQMGINIQEMARIALEKLAIVQQDGYLHPAAQYLLTDYGTWVPNPFWDGVTVVDFNEEYDS